MLHDTQSYLFAKNYFNLPYYAVFSKVFCGAMCNSFQEFNLFRITYIILFDI